MRFLPPDIEIKDEHQVEGFTGSRGRRLHDFWHPRPERNSLVGKVGSVEALFYSEARVLHAYREVRIELEKSEALFTPVVQQDQQHIPLRGEEDSSRLTAIASEKAISKIWDTPDEDAAWQHL